MIRSNHALFSSPPLDWLFEVFLIHCVQHINFRYITIIPDFKQDHDDRRENGSNLQLKLEPFSTDINNYYRCVARIYQDATRPDQKNGFTQNLFDQILFDQKTVPPPQILFDQNHSQKNGLSLPNKKRFDQKIAEFYPRMVATITVSNVVCHHPRIDEMKHQVISTKTITSSWSKHFIYIATVSNQVIGPRSVLNLIGKNRTKLKTDRGPIASLLIVIGVQIEVSTVFESWRCASSKDVNL